MKVNPIAEESKFPEAGPSGVGGWLAFLVMAMLVIGPLMSIGRTNADFEAVERQYPGLVNVPEWSSFKTVEWIAVLSFCAVSIYGGLVLKRRRAPQAVPIAKLVLWINYPISVAFTGMIIPYVMLPHGSTIAAEAIIPLIVSMIGATIWTAYLTLSKRVRNTYGLNRASPKGQTLSAIQDRAPVNDPVNNNPTASTPLADKRATPSRQSAGEMPVPEDDHIYTRIAEEIENGAPDKGLWTRLFAECSGDETQTKVLYIKQRAERLIAAERFEPKQVSRGLSGQAEKVQDKVSNGKRSIGKGTVQDSFSEDLKRIERRTLARIRNYKPKI